LGLGFLFRGFEVACWERNLSGEISGSGFGGLGCGFSGLLMGIKELREARYLEEKLFISNRLLAGSGGWNLGLDGGSGF